MESVQTNDGYFKKPSVISYLGICVYNSQGQTFFSKRKINIFQSVEITLESWSKVISFFETESNVIL